MDLIGTRIGNYVVRRLLGQGGMGRVYLCEHPLIGHQLAMKVLHEENAADPQLVKRFFQEARAAAAIGHENIVEVMDFGSIDTPEGPLVYLMMEALEGQSLTKWRASHGLDEAAIRDVLAQCCHALQQAHDRGIIHRDLKPENIYICPRPSSDHFVKIMDFGIAKLRDPDMSSARTRLGVTLGTPAYMSPEQCRGERDIDGRSDIYSLGVVLYELLTGRLPFPGDVGDAIRGHLYEQPPPPSAINPRVPRALEAIAMRALQKDRAHRFQSMDELATVLADTGFEAGEVARRAPTVRTGTPRAVPVALGALVFLLFLVVALVQRSGREHAAAAPDSVDAAVVSAADAGIADARAPDAAVPDASLPDADIPDARAKPLTETRKKPAVKRRGRAPRKRVDLEGVISPDL